LTRLAVGANDPAVYALASYACAQSSADTQNAACGQVSLQGWAKMDGGNVIPWLLMVNQAQIKKDKVAEADAFRHAAAAQSADAYYNSLLSFAESAIPSDVLPLERAYFSIEVLGLEAATIQMQYHAASLHCAATALQDPEVRDQCSTVAELLVTKGTTLLDVGMGENIGKRVGWSASRVDALEEEKDALQQATRQATLDGPETNSWSCESVKRLNAFFVQRNRLGEMGAMREAVERSGESVHDLAAKWQAYLTDLAREAAKRVSEAPADSGAAAD
jgi:hypothetical protein